MDQGPAVLAQEGDAVDIEDEVALVVGEGDRADERGGVAAGQCDRSELGDIGAAPVTGVASVEGLLVAGGTDFHRYRWSLSQARA